MEIRRIGLCILLILCTGLSQVDTATLTASIDPSPAVKGVTRGHTVRCDFSVATGDTLQTMNLFLTGGSPDRQIAVIYPGGSPFWHVNAPQDLKQRGTLGGSESQGFLTLAISDTLCSDLGQSYKCNLQWTATSSALSADQTATVALEAPPKAPEVMEVSPNSDNVTEFTEMTFTCRGNVGRPAGTFQWFTIADTTVDVTDQATQGNALAETAPGENCTFRRTSVLTLNVTRISQGKRLVVRCRVNHPTQGNSNPEACQDPDVDYCRMSQQLDIQYPVRVGVSSDAVTGEEGKDISITCTTQGNPLPYRIEWHREGDENNTLSTENGLTLRSLTLSDTGNYICTAYNLIEGSTRQDSVTVLVTVEKTTTPTPTTSSTSTAKTSTSVDNARIFKPESDSLLGPMLGSVLAVSLLLNIGGVIVFCWCRRSHRKSRAARAGPDPSVRFHETAATTNRQKQASTLTTQQSQAQSTTEADTNYYSDILDTGNNYSQLHPYTNDDADRKPYSTLT